MGTRTRAIDLDKIGPLIRQAKRIAKRYRRLTGRPLGITGEVAEYEAAHRLRLQLCEVWQKGYDCLRARGPNRRIQIKGRCILRDSSPGQRLSRIRLDCEWDSVMLVLLDEDFELVSIREAGRAAIEKELVRPGSKARNVRGQLSLRKFEAISKEVWPPR